jgi:YHS domain-containing protein
MPRRATIPAVVAASAVVAAFATAAACHAQPAAQPVPPVPTSAAGRTPDLEASPPPDRVMPADAVILQRGTVAPGNPSIFLDWEGNRYLFASEETRTVFRNDPVTFAARDGGACGRMGPLGGLGDARRYGIEEGLLYFFASDDCVERFRKDPHRYMEPYDLLPTGSPEQQAAGLAAFSRWVQWCGGKDAVKSAERYAQTQSREVLSGGKRWILTENIQVDGPRSMRRTDTWRRTEAPHEQLTASIETSDAASVLVDGRGTRTLLVPSRREAFERSVNRLPYAILRARFRPEAGFLAIRIGDGPISGVDCDFVRTWFEGNATNLAICKATGELVQMSYIGRNDDAQVGTITMNVLRSGDARALRLPVQWAVFGEGQTQTQPGPEISIRIEGSGSGATQPVPTPAQGTPASPQPGSQQPAR